MLSSARPSRLAAFLLVVWLITGCATLVKNEAVPDSGNSGQGSVSGNSENGSRRNIEIRGVNLLQTSDVALDSPLLALSLKRLVATGATTVALVPFMRQNSPAAEEVVPSDAVTDEQLIAGIRQVKKAGLRVILKPQILVENGWAGEIKPRHEAGWKNWFESYAGRLLHYAEIAEREGAEIFVVGTELKQTDRRQEWMKLIADVRRVYRGKLTYAAHNPDGVAGYAFWNQLDMIGVTLYPPLGEDVVREEMLSKIVDAVDLLEKQQRKINKEVLVAEVGVPSVAGGQAAPWQIPLRGVESDVNMQAMVLELWLRELQRRNWVRGVLVWDWFSDPYAGGRKDTDFTVQNKPAQFVVKCEWTGECASAF